MIRYLPSLFIVLLLAIVAHGQIQIDCPGPTGEQWSASQSSCVSGYMTSCDGTNQTTCYYASAVSGDPLGGIFVKSSRYAPERFIVINPGRALFAGIEPNACLQSLNGRPVTRRLLRSMAKSRPRLFRARFYPCDSRFRKKGPSRVVVIRL